MQLLRRNDYSIVKKQLSLFSHHTVLRAILDGTTSGRIYIDRQVSPNIIFIQFRHRAFIFGDHNALEVNAIEHFISTVVFGNCAESNVTLVRVTVENQTWLDFLYTSLDHYYPLLFDYQIYENQLSSLKQEFRVPEGFKLRYVSQKLLSENFGGKEDLIEEMCSERESVDAFLNKSFGITAFQGTKLAGWCLSEYNHNDRCEVGIATLPPYRRQGLAKAMTSKFKNVARNKGYKIILWHCYKSNTPSSRTALSSGFKLIDEHQVMNIYVEQSVGLAVHGNVAFEKGYYEKALSFYQQALNRPDQKTWMAWNAACAAAHQHLDHQVFMYLNLAIDLGFTDMDHLFESEHFGTYHDDPRWLKVTNRLSQ